MTDVMWKAARIDVAHADRLADDLGLPARAARCLLARGVTEAQAVEWLSNGDESATAALVTGTAWREAVQFDGLATAIDRLVQALETGERICVVGDYDVDGVTASTIMGATLSFLGADYICLIPHRIQDGYGLSEAIVERAAAQGARLIVTVDNGIRATAGALATATYGIDLIITDHHEPGDPLPDSVHAIVHWASAIDEERVRILSGAGVAWTVADALLSRLAGDREALAVQELRRWLVGLAALGALADVMPMTGHNWRLVRAGIACLRTCQRPGWLALAELARLELASVDHHGLLWHITPRLNAAGRMDSARAAFDLLMAKNAETASAAADEIEHWNQLRKLETERASAEALAQCREDRREHGAAIVLAGPWHLGVVGIVANKLADAFCRPAIVLADDGSDVLRGSGRAPVGYDLHAALCASEAHLVNFGGHEAAIGCAVHRSQLTAFRDTLMEHLETAGLHPSATAPASDAGMPDDYLPLAEVTEETLRWMERFRPFGPGHPPFTFYVGPVEVVRVTALSGGRHLRLSLREGGDKADAIWFQADAEAQTWRPGERIGAVVELERNTWKNQTGLQLRVVRAERYDRMMTREDFGLLYRLLKSRRTLHATQVATASVSCTPDDASMALDTFVELGFAQVRETAYHVVDKAVSRDLRDAPSYQRYLTTARRPCGEGENHRSVQS